MGRKLCSSGSIAFSRIGMSAGLRAAFLMSLLLFSASVASSATIVIVTVADGDSLLNGGAYAAGEEYLVAFQLIGGTTSDSFVDVSEIDLGSGSASPSSIMAQNATFGANGLSDGNVSLQITPADNYAYFLQNIVSGTQLQFTATLNGIYSPPIPDAFSFQLYNSNADLLYEQVFNITSSSPGGVPSSVPEPSTLFASMGGILLLAWAKQKATNWGLGLRMKRGSSVA